jgi:membrane protein implicated in regulation of membrane protease activity
MTNKLMIGGLLTAIALLVLLISHNLKGGTDYVMTIVWTAAIILFGVVEAVTAGLVCIWFVAGALVALVAAFVDAPLSVQIILFLVVSAAALALTRPVLRKITNATATPTNADRVLGEFAKVTETIDNENSTGAVYVDGKTWTARSTDGSVIPAGERVCIESMEGVKLLVKSVEKKMEVV